MTTSARLDRDGVARVEGLPSQGRHHIWEHLSDNVLFGRKTSHCCWKESQHRSAARLPRSSAITCNALSYFRFDLGGLPTTGSGEIIRHPAKLGPNTGALKPPGFGPSTVSP
jgi:hypothetical protein